MCKIVIQNFVDLNTTDINNVFPFLARLVLIKYLYSILLFVNFMSKFHLQKLRRDKINTFVRKRGYHMAAWKYAISRCLLRNS